MLRLAIAAFAASLCIGAVQAQTLRGGPIEHLPTDYDDAAIDQRFREAIQRSKELGLDRPGIPEVSATGNLGFPLRLRPNSKAFRSTGISNFVDLDASAGLKDFSCRQRTYDGHRGIDLFTWPYAWRMMAAREVEIVAAAPGTIVNKDDDNFDRQCAATGADGNFVIVRQDDGLLAMYWHMKKGSVTKKAIGQRVVEGEVLGLVGSSGNSTGPHLHFELRRDSNQTVVDPWQGKCGATARTLWRHQPEDIDTDFLRLATHSIQPPSPSGCADPNPGYSNRFLPGDPVWGVVYLRDQTPSTPVQMSLIKPDGQVHTSATSSSLPQIYVATWWWLPATIPSTGASGIWRLRATLEGKTREHSFVVGRALRPTTIAVSRKPASIALGAGAVAEFTVTVRNTGTQQAVGCSIVPDVPLAADWSTLQIVPAVSVEQTDRNFELDAGKAKRFKLTIAPKRRYKAKSITVPIRTACINANAPQSSKLTDAKLTF